jgi:NNP family nitrate/nitrite transporter-like MFS transporter
MLTFVFSGVLLGGLLIVYTLENLAYFSISCMIMGILLGIGNGAVFKMVPEVSTENIGSVTGIVGAVGGIGGFFPPIIIGFTKDVTGDYFLSFALLSILSMFCLILLHKGSNKLRVNVRPLLVHKK